MNLHTPLNVPDWKQINTEDINLWQRVAIATNGIVTIGNILSVSGLLVVIWAAFEVHAGNNLVFGLLLTIVGRLADLADGFAASITKTKSRLGEAVDTSCDKIGLFCLAIALVLSHQVPLTIITVIVVYHVYLALFGIIWGRRYQLHTSKYGKFATFVSWVVIVAALIHSRFPSSSTLSLAWLCFVAFLVLAVLSIRSYMLELRQATAKRLEFAAWTQEISGVIYLYNPRASNYKRADRLIQILCGELSQTPKRFDVTKGAKKVEEYLGKHANDTALLIAIAGGDGTVSSVVNSLVASLPEKYAFKLYILPLWGGNANDFSYMLNGLHSSMKPQRLLAHSAPIAIPFIKVDIATSKQTRSVYACCYASFGASAFAARRLDAQKFKTTSVMRWFPPLLVVRELLFVIRAFIDSPVTVAEIDNKETSFYEHTLVNGSRLAKVNRIPIQIDEPAFFHAFVQRKHPSILVTIGRIMLGRPDTVYAKKTTVQFTTRQSVDAQIDGEVIHLDANTKVTASVVHTAPLAFISTRLTVKTS
jgi:phosphatidylglycerophosphate synthase/diacylglycerol kinase family enzyme